MKILSYPPDRNLPRKARKGIQNDKKSQFSVKIAIFGGFEEKPLKIGYKVIINWPTTDD